MSELLHVEVSAVAAEQIREAEAWWRTNRSKAPNAIREELERASALVATRPDIGSRARNVRLVGVGESIWHEFDITFTIASTWHRRRSKSWASGMQAAEAHRRSNGPPNDYRSAASGAHRHAETARSASRFWYCWNGTQWTGPYGGGDGCCLWA